MKKAVRVTIITLLCIAFFAAAIATYVALFRYYPAEKVADDVIEAVSAVSGFAITLFILILGEFEVLRLVIFPFCSRRSNRQLLIINVLLAAISLFMAAFELAAVFGPVPEGEWIAIVNILLILVFRVYYCVLARRSKPEQSA